ncbi:MAG: hypothetical protein WGN25_02615 [Candidatus Electrothrix sp. GW3-4]|uniref:hypothetical protein n=1 Tax=Candidatus Electrothrix sp. GW3-4 TaxID=3126740 RepID=UPI0030CD7ACA
MPEYIMEHIEWVFSGIGVAVLSVIGRWFFKKRNKGVGNIGSNNRVGRDHTFTIDKSVHQTHSGDGDNVAGDKIVKG